MNLPLCIVDCAWNSRQPGKRECQQGHCTANPRKPHRRLKKIRRITLQLGLANLLLACQLSTFNDSVYPYVYRSELISTNTPQKLVIAHVNFGVPSKSYLQGYSLKLDQKVQSVLEQGGFEIADNGNFRSFWRAAVRKHGDVYNESMAQLNTEAFKKVVGQTLAQLAQSGEADAVVFTDLLENPVVFQGANNRLAKWHGVSRKPRIKGRASLPAEFDWSQTAPAVSLRVIVYSVKGELLFKSLGGLEVTRHVDTSKNNGRFVRRDKLFSSAGNVDEGVRLALHPLVPVRGYPEQ
ncbi:MAG: hypothetical protein KJP25_04275 [Gammaproteobacteria bacterium]|nr:hypothetical protein [Gammaproteobacteria bacterium]NND40191.1 hypothetical protein [Pseudomonadales bacterium]MBT8152232.1 hypothetical protein [Gammaproteobacteria bacterium]NNL11855.1 hypothetical protein [Pseudomonadales bacterium]NNM11527.1 hypothetical protein [Pseudomonadales bacterium]